MCNCLRRFGRHALGRTQFPNRLRECQGYVDTNRTIRCEYTEPAPPCPLPTHLLGPIEWPANVRRCVECSEPVPAALNTESHPGTVERYPRSIFSQWTHKRIRRYLRLQSGDLLLENAEDNFFYVFRSGSSCA